MYCMDANLGMTSCKWKVSLTMIFSVDTLSCQAVHEIVDLLHDDLECQTEWSHSVPVDTQVLEVLHLRQLSVDAWLQCWLITGQHQPSHQWRHRRTVQAGQQNHHVSSEPGFQCHCWLSKCHRGC